MKRDEAVEKIKVYFQSWVEQDFNKFASVLHEEAVVRDCSGKVIEGKIDLHRWFVEWHARDREVLFWTIHRIGYDPEQLSAFVEWTFECSYEGEEYEWDGASIVYLKDELIVDLKNVR